MLVSWNEAFGGMGPWIVWAASEPSWFDGVLVVLKVVVGLCMVIFVHELGHFLVAKLNGVWCEKFYLGFDFFGLRLFRFRWGETEYGIGVFPLGGYVKMLGQEDNPGRLQEEIQRAKAAQSASTALSSQNTQTDQDSDISQSSPISQSNKTPQTSETPTTPANSPEAPAASEELAALEAALYHPRSYLAKSVPQRMAIIAAGVGMNVVFAFLAAVWALGVGVEDIRCGVGEVAPGQPAWQKNLQPGDHILEIAGRKVERFQQLRTDISLGDLSEGVELVVQRPGVAEPWTVHVYPERRGKYPTIGVGVPWTNQLMRELATVPGTAAAQAQPALMPGDRIVQVNATPVSNYAELRRALAQTPDQPITLRVRRPRTNSAPGPETKQPAVNPKEAQSSADSKRSKEAQELAPHASGQASEPTEEIEVRIQPQPIRRLGLILEMGPITAIQDDSPAQRVGLLPGDVLTKVDGQPVGDPLTLPERLRRKAQAEPGRAISVAILRQGKMIEFAVPLRRADFYYDSFVAESPVAVPALGIAYSVKNQVVGLIPGSPAEQAGIVPGSLLLAAQVLPPEDLSDLPLSPVQRQHAQKMLAIQIRASLGEKLNWPYLVSRLQHALPGSTVQLQWQDPQGQEHSARLTPTALEGGFDPLRGLLLEPETFTRKADSFVSAIRLGYREAVDSLTMIFRMLRALGSGQVSATELRGPIGIIDAAVQFASAGTGEFLLFLCILSANLAVLNFLPIPVLDGGHILFLAYEGLRGKPPSERVLITLTYLGLFFILGLVLWVTGLDIGRWFAGK